MPGRELFAAFGRRRPASHRGVPGRQLGRGFGEAKAGATVSPASRGSMAQKKLDGRILLILGGSHELAPALFAKYGVAIVVGLAARARVDELLLLFGRGFFGGVRLSASELFLDVLGSARP